MNFEESDAWIFLAIQQVASADGARVHEISLAADGINHAVPSEKELAGAFRKLSSARLIEKNGKRYRLTPLGLEVAGKATSHTLSAKWKEYLSILNRL